MTSPARKADVVADDLLRRIVSGELPVGALLPREAELAEGFGVNRSVVREAVKLLEVHRLVRPVRRRGTEILDPVASMSPEVLRAMLQPEPGRIDRAALAELLEIRAHIDEQMTALAAARRRDDDLARLEACLASLREALPDANRYVRCIDDFALTLARATQNRIFQMLVHWQRMVVGEMADVFRASRPNTPAHLSGMTLVVELLRNQEVEQVRSLVRAYHAWATPRMLAAAALASGEPLDTAVEGLR